MANVGRHAKAVAFASKIKIVKNMKNNSRTTLESFCAKDRF